MDRDYVKDDQGNDARDADGNRIFTVPTDSNPKPTYTEKEADHTGLGLGHTERNDSKYDTDKGEFKK